MESKCAHNAKTDWMESEAGRKKLKEQCRGAIMKLQKNDSGIYIKICNMHIYNVIWFSPLSAEATHRQNTLHATHQRQLSEAKQFHTHTVQIVEPKQCVVSTSYIASFFSRGVVVALLQYILYNFFLSINVGRIAFLPGVVSMPWLYLESFFLHI